MCSDLQMLLSCQDPLSRAGTIQYFRVLVTGSLLFVSPVSHVLMPVSAWHRVTCHDRHLMCSHADWWSHSPYQAHAWHGSRPWHLVTPPPRPHPPHIRLINKKAICLVLFLQFLKHMIPIPVPIPFLSHVSSSHWQKYHLPFAFAVMPLALVFSNLRWKGKTERLRLAGTFIKGSPY